jgi:thioesterase domain-containing protein
MPHLDPNQPVYGVHPGPLRDDMTMMAAISALASHYASEIQKFQPKGPYQLCGSSFGGVLAYEVARQLSVAGQQVGLLAILDTSAYTMRRKWSLNEQWLLFKLRLQYRLRTTIHGNAQDFINYMKLKLQNFRHRRSAAAAPDESSADRLKRVLLGALWTYIPEPYYGEVSLIRAMERGDWLEYDPQNGWGQLALGGLNVCEVPGNHDTFVQEPYVRATAETLNCLFVKREPQAPSEANARDAAMQPSA